MKLLANDLQSTHKNLICLMRWTTRSTGVIGHSHAHGLESGSVSTRHVLLGRIKKVTKSEVVFGKCGHLKHRSDLSWSLGPHFTREESYSIDRKLLQGLIYLNQSDSSNAIAQHLRRREKGRQIWLEWPKFEEILITLRKK